jgi:hypothetical protein
VAGRFIGELLEHCAESRRVSLYKGHFYLAAFPGFFEGAKDSFLVAKEEDSGVCREP